MLAEQAVGKIRCEATIEREVRARGFHFVAGVDEVGRGALFGPVFAAAVILSPDRPVRGLNDSKQLEPERRVVLAGRIRERAVAWAVAGVDAATIDRINIYHASRLAMKLAVEKLQPAADFLLIDALYLDVPVAQRALIQGDALSRDRGGVHSGQGRAGRLHARMGRGVSRLRIGPAQGILDAGAL